MQLQHSIQNTFAQLSDSLEQLNDEQFTQPCKRLFQASIGQHVRHIIELFICLEHGYQTGVINYEKRKRDVRIENDKVFAQELLFGIGHSINKPDKELLLEGNYNEHTEETTSIPSNYYRELLYNLEHTIHHMALIRVGINEIASIQIPQEYGVAASTIKYKKACAQ